MGAKLNLGTAVRLLVAAFAVLAVAAPIATAHSVTAATHKALKSCGKKGSKHRCACPHGSKLKHSGGRFRCVKPHHSSPPTTSTPSTGGSPTTTPASTPFPLGVYTCSHTVPTLDPLAPPNSFDSFVVATLTFNSDGTYHKANDIVGGNWHESGNTIVFTSGLLWQSGNFDQGQIFPSGTTMPNAAPAVANGYTLVIKDTQQEGADPPSQEFSSTDGPNGAFSISESFWYCKM